MVKVPGKFGTRIAPKWATRDLESHENFQVILNLLACKLHEVIQLEIQLAVPASLAGELWNLANEQQKAYMFLDHTIRLYQSYTFIVKFLEEAYGWQTKLSVTRGGRYKCYMKLGNRHYEHQTEEEHLHVLTWACRTMLKHISQHGIKENK